MKTFSKLIPFQFGELMTFLGSKGLRTLSGVCSSPIFVMVQEKDSEPVLFQAFGIGPFSFDFASQLPFNIWFEGSQDGVLSIVVPPHSTLLIGDPEFTYTKVDHRPAINPELASINRELAAMRSQIKRFKAPAAPSFNRPAAPLSPVVVDEKMVPPASDVIADPLSIEPVRASPDIGGSL
jgi:hypothetical protein